MSTPIDLEILPGIPSQGYFATWVTPTLADPSKPAVTELTGLAATYLSCRLNESLEIEVDQETWDETLECAENAIERLGRVKTTISDIIVKTDPQNPESDLSRADTALVKDTTVYVIRRVGVKSRETPVAGQYVEVYKVRVGAKSFMPPEAEGDIRRRVKVTVLDSWTEGVKLV